MSVKTSIDIENVNVQHKMYIIMISTIMKVRIVKEVITMTIIKPMFPIMVS